MTRVTCLYPDRERVLIAHLYDDIDAADRVLFETHVTTCPPCRSELAELRGVRATLGEWAAPESPGISHQSPVASHQSSVAWWHAVPVWAQVAAAMLVLGVSASIANLDVRYDRNGLNIRTGWSKPAAAPQAAQTTANATMNTANDAAPWRAELTALQTQLRSELRAQAATVKAVSLPATVNTASTASAESASAMSDDEFSRRVRVLLADSEKKQQKELALHLMQLQVDFNAQLQVDRSRTNQLFRDVTNTLGPAIMNQQRQVNYQLPVSGK
jgi:hypothetical protein